MNGYRRYSGVVLAGSFVFIVFLLSLTGRSQARERSTQHLNESAPLLQRDAAVPGTAGSLELLAQVGGAISSVASDGEHLYVTSGPRLLVLSLEANPQLVGRSAILPDQVVNVAVTGTTAVVSTSKTLYTVDITDPSQPTILGSLPYEYDYLSQSPGEVLATPGFVYVVFYNAVSIVDISDPTQPHSIAAIYGTLERITSAAIQDKLLLLGEVYAYCGKFGCLPEEHRAVLVDVGEPNAPRVLAEVPLQFYVQDVALDGNMAYIVEGSIVRVVDISDPSMPMTLAQLIGLATSNIGRFVVKDGVVYMSASEELLVYDFSLPTTPNLLSKVALPATNIMVADTMVAIAEPCGLRMVDVTDLHQPVIAGMYVTIQPYHNNRFDEAMILDGEVLYLAAGSCLQVIDVSEPSVPSLLSWLEGVSVERLHQKENLLYVSGGRTLSIIDIADPANPELLNSFVLPLSSDCSDLAVVVANDYAYAKCRVNDHGSVIILDLSNPLAPRWVGQYPLPDPGSYAIAAAPGYLYLIEEFTFTGAGNEIHIVDVSTPSNPIQLATVPVGGSEGWLVDLAVDFPELLLLRQNGLDTLQIVDVANPLSPRRTATLSVEGFTVVPADGYIYILGGYSEDYGELLTIYTRPPITAFPFVTTLGCGQGCDYGQAAVASQDLLFTGPYFLGLWVHRFTPTDVTGTFFPILGK